MYIFQHLLHIPSVIPAPPSSVRRTHVPVFILVQPQRANDLSERFDSVGVADLVARGANDDVGSVANEVGLAAAKKIAVQKLCAQHPTIGFNPVAQNFSRSHKVPRPSLGLFHTLLALCSYREHNLWWLMHVVGCTNLDQPPLPHACHHLAKYLASDLILALRISTSRTSQQ
eukprot:CAMPEP_0179407596 /NCGR_PEP_ID=MMETSP0799-20121207/1599_1 /TAXON_ID=46947 /ORGANISM="Geminigera cryophila, Strain CCMP2564" /LENGTH=171 /DNA_ID=CAMNT_0021178911 /DNA_START=496 /DNA_END=1012 /DNA_ORIENTATION=-